MTNQSSQEFDAGKRAANGNDATAGEQSADVVDNADNSTDPRTAEPEVLSATETPEPAEGEAGATQQVTSSAVLAVGGGIEVNGLQANQVSVLQEQHAQGLIEVQRKASELKVDIQALDQTLESLTSQARTANDAGVNITATHTQNTTLGQTEIIVGNTQRAAAGKVAPLWSGLDNNQLRTGLIVAGAVVVGALLTALFT